MGRAGQTWGLKGGRVAAAREEGPGNRAGLTAPPLARRPVISPAMALREEINDSWRLLVGSLGAALLVATLLFLIATSIG